MSSRKHNRRRNSLVSRQLTNFRVVGDPTTDDGAKAIRRPGVYNLQKEQHKTNKQNVELAIRRHTMNQASPLVSGRPKSVPLPHCQPRRQRVGCQRLLVVSVQCKTVMLVPSHYQLHYLRYRQRSSRCKLIPR
jgi:hypothetical protein